MGAPFHALALLLGALPFTQDDTYQPEVHDASDEGVQMMASFELADGFRVTQFAAEPMLANPVCFYIDHGGAVYVGESFRVHHGVTDIREHVEWLDDDLSAKSVADRLALMEKHEGERFADYGKDHDRIRLIRDTDGDGVADEAVVFADGFNKPEDGIGAGVLSYQGAVYYTCIPDLWLLHDQDGDGRSDSRKSLSTGYGVNINLLGHDMHGLRIGPDGLLYFSIGDRGFRVETEGRVLDHTETGAVLRCRLDGSGLEIVHTGLRNPQELVFDDFGNLFTGDNNSDGGDRARWVQIIEGADSGWRFPYQWIFEPVNRGPWNDEKLWHPQHEGQAAYIVPPIANIGHGPSGLTHNPGTGLPPRYDGHFFLCDFRGQASISGVHAFKNIAKGAGFEMSEPEKFVWGTLVTDVEFGMDGAVYFSDWVSGWGLTGKGRIYRMADPEVESSELVAETRRLLAEGMASRTADELASLLAHADQRVRQEAQFALVKGGADGLAHLQRAAALEGPLLARLHGIWGAGMVGRDDPQALAPLVGLLNDAHPEVRAQTVKVLGDARHTAATAAVIERLSDESPRVQYFAALACGKLGDPAAVERLADVLRKMPELDATLRHAVVMGLDGCATDEQIQNLTLSAQAAMGALLVMRRREMPEITGFLGDHSPDFRLEAARAIYDVPIPEAMSALADLVESPKVTGAALTRRVLAANLRVGGEVAARRLGTFALRDDVEERYRSEAIDMLASWGKPSPRDWVVGAWRPIPERDASFVLAIANDLAGRGVLAAPESVIEAWVRLVESSGATDPIPHLIALVDDSERSGGLRARALEALEELIARDLPAVVGRSLNSSDGVLRASALAALEQLAPGDAVPRLPAILAHGERQERRAAYRILSRLQTDEAIALLSTELERLNADLIPAELALDLVMAVEANGHTTLSGQLERHKAVRRVDPLLADSIDSLFGGDRASGDRLFHQHEQAQCSRCHATGEEEGLGIGPNLRGVGERRTRLEMLESILAPNRHVAAGYESTTFVTIDELIVAGRVVESGEGYVVVQDSQGNLTELADEEIETRKLGVSSMPEGMPEFLTRSDLRDLIEYLARL